MKNLIKKNIKLIFEDNHIIVITKPSGILSQADNTGEEDMLTILKQYIKDSKNKQGNVFLGLIHRLDRPAGGVMVFAKTSKAAARISQQIRDREFEKEYIAVIKNTNISESGRLTHYLYKDIKTNTVKTVKESYPGAKKAELEYTIIKRKNEFAWVSIRLITGRYHQIRVQFSTIGAPLFGDAKYGKEIFKRGSQLALWSNKIIFKHPVTKKKLIFSYPPAEDFFLS